MNTTGESASRHRWPGTRSAAALLAAAHLALSCGYSLATPIGEAPDEQTHLEYVAHLASSRGLPPLDAPEADVLRQAKHPPLFYAAAAALAGPSLAGDFGRGPEFIPNPHFAFTRSGEPLPAQARLPGSAFPGVGPYRAAWRARAASIIAGAVAVAATVALAAAVAPGRPDLAWTAGAFAAFLPQFLFMSAVVNTDAMVAAMSAVAMVLAVRHAQPSEPDTGRGRPFLLGIAVGAAMLTKLSAIFLVPVAAAAVAVRPGSGRAKAGAAVMVAAGTFIAVGPWLIRNAVITGDPFGVGRWLSAAGDMTRRTSLLAEIDQYLLITFTSFWGRFGWVSVPMPGWVYGLCAIASALAAAGIVRLAWRVTGQSWVGRQRGAPRDDSVGPTEERCDDISLAGLALLGMASGGAAVLLLQLAAELDLVAAQGRYLFGALAPLSVLIAAGWLEIVPRRHTAAVASGSSLLMAILAVFALVAVLVPAFGAPTGALAGLPEAAHPLAVRFNGTASLYGYAVDGLRVREGTASPIVEAGSPLSVTLYWRRPLQPEARAPVDGFVVAIQLVDLAGEIPARLDRPLFDGRLPLAAWDRELVYPETYLLRVDPAALPALAELRVSLYPLGRPGSPLGAWKEAAPEPLGNAAGLTPVRIVASPDVPADLRPAGHTFGAAIWMDGFSIRRGPGEITVTVVWSATSPPDVDATVFLHLVDESGAPVVVADGPPAGGALPASSWLPGERIVDLHTLSLAGVSAGRYSVALGLYDPATGARLAARDPSGAALADDAAILDSVDVP